MFSFPLRQETTKAALYNHISKVPFTKSKITK